MVIHTYTSLLGGKNPQGRAVIELQAAEPPQSINVFPSPGKYAHPAWGDFEVTLAANQEFVTNFNNHVYQEHVPIDAEHELPLSGAVGYMRRLSMNSDGSVEAEVEWTERGQKLIRDDSYRYISPQWYEDWVDPATKEKYTNILIGAALTTRPFFKGLRSLVASEGHLYDLSDRIAITRKEDEVEKKDHTYAHTHSSSEEETMTVDVEKMDDAEKVSVFQRLAASLKATVKFGHEEETHPEEEEEETTPVANAGKPSENTEDSSTEEAVKTAAEVTSLRAAVDAEKKAREAAEKRLQGLEAQERGRRYKDIILGRDEAGVHAAAEGDKPLYPMVGDHASKLQLMETLAATRGEDSAEFTSYVAMEREHASQLRAAGMFSETGVDSTGEPAGRASATSEFDQKIAAAKAADPKLSDSEAIAKVAKEDPQLYDAYDRSITGRKSRLVG